MANKLQKTNIKKTKTKPTRKVKKKKSKSSIKPLIPSLREKKRYLVFQVLTVKDKKFQPVSLPLKAVKDSFQRAVKDFLGSYGSGKAGVIILGEHYNKKNGKIIIRVNNKYVDQLKAALILIQEINKTRVIVRSLLSSGVLRKAKNEVCKE